MKEKKRCIRVPTSSSTLLLRFPVFLILFVFLAVAFVLPQNPPRRSCLLVLLPPSLYSFCDALSCPTWLRCPPPHPLALPPPFHPPTATSSLALPSLKTSLSE